MRAYNPNRIPMRHIASCPTNQQCHGGLTKVARITYSRWGSGSLTARAGVKQCMAWIIPTTIV